MKNWKEIESKFDIKFLSPVSKWAQDEYGKWYTKYDVREFFKSQFKEIMEDMIGEERVIGDTNYCGVCKQHIAAGDCDCGGYNICRQEMLDKIDNFFKEPPPEDLNGG